MKVGDLVQMPCALVFGQSVMGESPSVGIVVNLGPVPHRPNTLNRVGVLWPDGEGVDYEPKAWLEVISESR